MKKFLIPLLLFVILTSSCVAQYVSKADYFGGNALVEYNQTMMSGSNDNLTLTFNKKGDYQVIFSYTKGYETNIHNTGKATLPENITISVTDSPITKVVTQYVLPGFLTVAITYDGVTESHDFK